LELVTYVDAAVRARIGVVLTRWTWVAQQFSTEFLEESGQARNTRGL